MVTNPGRHPEGNDSLATERVNNLAKVGQIYLRNPTQMNELVYSGLFAESLELVLTGLRKYNVMDKVQIIRSGSKLPGWHTPPQSILGYFRKENVLDSDWEIPYPWRFWDLVNDNFTRSCGNGFKGGLQYQLSIHVPDHFFGWHYV